MIAETRESSSDVHHRLDDYERPPDPKPAYLPTRIRVPNKVLQPGLLAFLRRSDELAQDTRLTFTGLELVSWEAVCQLYAWAVAKHERGGRLILEFSTQAGWHSALAVGLGQDEDCLTVVPPEGLQDATGDGQDATPGDDD